MTYIEGSNPISNTESVIDSRDVIARIAYLTSELEDLTDTEREDYADEIQELTDLEALADSAEGYIADWQYGETLIHSDYFVEYVQQYLSDIGDLPSDIPEYLVIDWEETADNVGVDYSEFTFGGETHLAR